MHYLLVLYFNPKTFTVSHLVTLNSVNFGGGQGIFVRKTTYEKLTKCSNFIWYIPEKLTKFPLPEFYITFARKTFFRDFFLGGGEATPSRAGPQAPHQLNPAMGGR